MNAHYASDDIPLQIERIAGTVGRYAAESTSDDERVQVDGWRKRIEELRIETQRPVTSAIALLGESGAGKSTLVNALIDMDLLPHDNSEAVTAIVSEIGWKEDGFELVVEIKSESEFLSAFVASCRRARQALEDAGAEGDRSAVANGVDVSERADVEQLTGLGLEEVLRQKPAGKETDLIQPEILTLLRNGPAQRWRFATDDVRGLRDACWKCLRSKGLLRPIVNRVAILGPFEVTRSGVRIIDVPGLNDPDPVRDGIARDALQKAKLVWWVASTTRVMSQKVHEYLVESRQLMRLAMEGRLSSFGTVVTKVDEINRSGLAAQFNVDLSQKHPREYWLDLNRRRVEEVARRAIVAAWDETTSAAGSHVTGPQAEAGRRDLAASSFFGVSSFEYLHLRDLLHVDPDKQPELSNEAQTGVPALRDWITTEFAGRERKSECQRLRGQVGALQQAVRAALNSRRSQKSAVYRLATSEKGGLRDIRKNAQDFLEAQIRERSKEQKHKAEAQAQRVKDAIDAGVKDVGRALERDLPAELSKIHWLTLRAICRHGGKFAGSKKHWDVPAELAGIVARKVAFAWKELFEARARQFCEQLETEAGVLASAHAQLLASQVAAQLSVPTNTLAVAEISSPAMGFEIARVLAHLEQELQSSRMRFERDLIESFRRELKPAFLGAASESGKGMKDRIVQRVSAEVAASAPDLLPALLRDLHEKVAEVTGILKHQVDAVHVRVSELAERTSRNLEADLSPISPSEFSRQIELLSWCIDQLNDAV
jgi:hypothetical protein